MPDHNAALDRPLPGAASLEVALTSARGTRPEHCHGRCPRLPDLFALAKTVAEISFGCDDATRQRTLDDLVREISEFEAEYASTSGSEMRHGQRPVLSRPRFDL